VRESPERLAEIEKLLRNQKMMEKIVTGKLELRAFSLITREPFETNPEYERAFAERVIEQVQTFLYTKSGMSEAGQQGRKMWFDPNTLTLVLTDTPDNIQAVDDFLGTLPELKPKERFKVIYLRHALSDDLESNLSQLMGLSTAEQAGTETGLTVTKTLRREDEFTWRDLTIVVRRVTAGGDIFDELSDEAELVLRVQGGRQSTTQTVRELDVPVYIQDAVGGEYEIYAEDIKPSTTPNEGRVKLTITYNPPGTGAQF